MVELTGEEILWIRILTGSTATTYDVNGVLCVKTQNLLADNPITGGLYNHSNSMFHNRYKIQDIFTEVFPPPRPETTIGDNTYYTDELELALGNIKPLTRGSDIK